MVTGWGELQDSYQTSADFEVPRFSSTLLLHTSLAHFSCTLQHFMSAHCRLHTVCTVYTEHSTHFTSAQFDNLDFVLCNAVHMGLHGTLSQIQCTAMEECRCYIPATLSGRKTKVNNVQLFIDAKYIVPKSNNTPVQCL